MITLDLVQGTRDWDLARFTGSVAGVRRCTASEAAAMMGASKRCTRSELLRMKATGDDQEFSDWVKNTLFADGHESERKQRILIEDDDDILGEDLYPVTGISDDYDWMMASLDGLTMDGRVNYEHKIWNEKLAEQVRNKKLDPLYYWQLEQQMLVSGAEVSLFIVSDGTAENREYMWYKPVKGRAKKLLAGWGLFRKDLAEYVPEVVTAEYVPAPVKTLPALNYKMDGLSLTSNFAQFQEAANQLVEDSKKPIETDDDFADRNELNKSFGETEGKIKLLCDQVIGEVKDIDTFRRGLLDIGEIIRQARLNGEKLVAARKVEIRGEILTEFQNAYTEYVRELNARFDKPYLTAALGNIPVCDLAAVMKGKKTVLSLRSSCDTELARCKIESNELADLYQSNLKMLSDKYTDYGFLFKDIHQIVGKDPEDLLNLAAARVKEYDDEQAQKKIDADAEKLRIAAEQQEEPVSEQAPEEDVKGDVGTTEQAETGASALSPIETLEDMQADRNAGKTFNPKKYDQKTPVEIIMANLDKSVMDGIQEIDAAVFSSDSLLNPANRAYLNKFVSRWLRALNEYDN